MAAAVFSRVGLRYEVACDVIATLIAQRADAIAAELAKPIPDLQQVERWEAEQARLEDARDALDHRDAEAIEEAITTYGAQARSSHP